MTSATAQRSMLAEKSINGSGHCGSMIREMQALWFSRYGDLEFDFWGKIRYVHVNNVNFYIIYIYIIYIHIYTHTYIHACLHTYIHTYVRTYIYTYVHIYIYYIYIYVYLIWPLSIRGIPSRWVNQPCTSRELLWLSEKSAQWVSSGEDLSFHNW